MKKSRFTEAQIVGILHEAEKGELAITEICRVHGIAPEHLLPLAQALRRP